MYFLWLSNDFPKDFKVLTRLKSGFLTLGNENYEGIGKNIWFCGVFMNKRKIENDVSWKKGRGKRAMQQFFDLDFCRISEVLKREKTVKIN